MKPYMATEPTTGSTSQWPPPATSMYVMNPVNPKPTMTKNPATTVLGPIGSTLRHAAMATLWRTRPNRPSPSAIPPCVDTGDSA
jgi:hypothetical protein